MPAKKPAAKKTAAKKKPKKFTVKLAKFEDVFGTTNAASFFVLIQGPTGSPPMMQIRGPAPTPAATCTANVQIVPVFPFTLTGSSCPDGPICKG